jgi:signal transduction histidine kinase/DNA-binding response OmpR family regulator/HPt (histidine-containing phosphotransfer) domain-containing protein
MKLQVRSSLYIIFSLSFAAVVAAYVFNQVILQEFETLENSQAERNTARLIEGWQTEFRTLATLVRDWALWDDALAYTKNRNDAFEEANLNYSTLSSLEVTHVAIFNSESSLIFGSIPQHSSQSLKAIQPSTTETIVTTGILKKALESASYEGNQQATPGIEGILQIEGEKYLFAAHAISNSAGTSQPAGVIIMTRELSTKFTTRVKNQTQLDLFIAPKDTTALPPPSTLTLSKTAFTEPKFLKLTDSIKSSILIKDIFGAPAFEVGFSSPRDIFRKGEEISNFLTIVFIAFTLITSALVISLLRFQIINPLKHVGNSLLKISEKQTFSERIVLSGNDELTDLAGQINNTLETLQSSLLKAETAQHQAEAANAAKSSFIAKVSHELRTPIHSITGMLRILLKEERSSAKRNYIVMARNSAYGLLETINEILDFSKAEAGKLSIERIEFSIHDVIREAIQTIGARVEEKGSLETVIEIAQGLPSKVYGDPLRLRQVLVNLLGNATKFTKEGHIGLSVKLTSNESERVGLELTIFDTGVGIPADRLEHIFEPFGQADESVSRMFTGTGLGLTIVKQFIEAMGGSVRVESTVGVGSRFVLNIQLEVCRDAKPISYRPLLSSQRIALLDNNSLVVERFSQELEENGYIPVIVNCDDPGELNEVIKSLNQYGLIIVTSEALKRSRVFDLVVELRGRESVPVISILSPYEISVRERLVALEVPFVVTRPIALLDLLGVISGEVALNDEGWEDADDASLSSSRPLEILIADDAQTNRIILTELLRDAGHHVVCVENGIDMVSRVRDSLEAIPGNKSFDLILTDVQMPLLDGLTATSRIRDMERDKNVSTHLPIVAVTAHAMTEEVSRMRQFGVDDVVTKPLDPMKLGAVIQRLTGQGTNSKEKPIVKAAPKQLTEADLSQLGIRLWTQMAKRDDSLIELFGLSEDPMSPEDFQRVLDIEDVLERSGNSIRRTLLIFGGFLECFREQLQKLNEAKQTKDTDGLRFTSHALKGLLLDVGARASGGLASSIEQHCKNGEPEAALALVNQLVKQVLLVSRLVSQIHTTASGEGNKSMGINTFATDSTIDLGETDSEPN